MLLLYIIQITPSYNKRWIKILAILVLVIVHLAQSIVLLLPLIGRIQKCHKNDTNHNVSYTSLLQESDYQQIYDQERALVFTVLAGTSFLYMLEYCYLISGIYNFHKKQKEWKIDIKIYKLTRNLVKDTLCCKKKKDCVISFTFISSFLLMFTLVGAMLGLGIHLTHTYEVNYSHCNNSRAIIISYSLEAVIFLSNLITGIFRIVMTFYTFMCTVIWSKKYGISEETLLLKNDKLVINKRKNNVSTNTVLDQLCDAWKAASDEYYKCIKDYDARTDIAKVVYQIFSSWFVIQWAIHAIEFILSLVELLVRILYGNKTDPEIIAYIVLDAGFDFLVLIISYICAVQMNSHMKEYLHDQRKKSYRTEACNSTLQYSLSRTTFAIEKNPDSEFKPHIPGTGIDISIETPGFIAGMALGLLAMVATLAGLHALK